MRGQCFSNFFVGEYYLVDAGYTNCKGFLAPFRGQRYHLNEWRVDRKPQNPLECFNMRHSSARNVIERCFGILKKRWTVLRSPTFYPLKVQMRVITACCLLHNLIRRDSVRDPLDGQIETFPPPPPANDDYPAMTMEPSDAWNNFRLDLADRMFNAFQDGEGQN